MLEIDKFSRVPIYEQIIAQMETHIRLGTFAPEEPLPSVRTLSVSVGVNPNTLQKAYAELERRGLCFSVPGSRRFVARSAQTLLMLRAQKRQEELGKLLSALMEAGMSRNELHAFVDDIADQRSERKDMIEVKGITKTFDGRAALHDLSCTIENGRIYGLVGSNGAGKSTLIRLMTGVYRPDRGGIAVDGAPVFDNPSVKRRMVYVSDDIYFLPQANMRRMALLYAASYPSFSMKRFEEFSHMFGLDPKASLSTFSKGMRRQAAVILALCCYADFIFMDETFDGLDPVMRELVKRVIYSEMEQRGATAVIASHSLRELEDTATSLRFFIRRACIRKRYTKPEDLPL
jgi:ABC-type Na+ transport system ATPase subunit NatA/DNA-binding transcriptional regulator YhcF (GntR family)